LSQAWWRRLVIPRFERLKQEDGEFEASLSYTARSCFKNQKKSKNYNNFGKAAIYIILGTGRRNDILGFILMRTISVIIYPSIIGVLFSVIIE
jgi:hypothetical protein